MSDHQSRILAAFTDARPLRVGEVQARIARNARVIYPRDSLRVRLGLLAKAGVIAAERIDHETIWRRAEA